MLANQLKGVLTSIISVEQSALVPGRLITENVLVAFEVLYSIRRKTSGKTGLMGLKLNMSKAYDRVELGFLSAMMRRMGCPIDSAYYRLLDHN